jgi:FAD:protein FMN transferase
MQEYAYSQRHMDTDVTITFVTDEELLANNIAAEVFATVAKYEQIFSRFLPTSELARLNVQSTLVVSDIFMKVLEKALAVHRQTGGVFNPLIQVVKQGYIDDYTTINDAIQTATSVPYNHDVNDIFYDTTTREVRLAPTQQLDFGGILKGYLAEQIAHTIMAAYPTCSGTIINIGGDLHTRGLDEHNQPFTFFISNPVSKVQTPITIKDTSLVTSGTYKRHWQTDLGPRHHIIGEDGLTNPTSPVISASVVYEDGAAAEAFAKYLLITYGTHFDSKLLPEGLQYHLVLEDGSLSTNTT